MNNFIKNNSFILRNDGEEGSGIEIIMIAD